MKAGLAVGEFWDLTPKELWTWFEADAWRQRRERRRDAWLAWHVAGLMRVRRLPSIDTLAPAEPRTMTADEKAERQREHAALVERLGHGRRK